LRGNSSRLTSVSQAAAYHAFIGNVWLVITELLSLRSVSCIMKYQLYTFFKTGLLHVTTRLHEARDLEPREHSSDQVLQASHPC
jgi:hypothetical protein